MSEKILRLVGCRREERAPYLNLLSKICYEGILNPLNFETNKRCENLAKAGLLKYEDGFKITGSGKRLVSIVEMEEDLGFSNF